VHFDLLRVLLRVLPRVLLLGCVTVSSPPPLLSPLLLLSQAGVGDSCCSGRQFPLAVDFAVGCRSWLFAFD